jgi:hypothetical protein
MKILKMGCMAYIVMIVASLIFTMITLGFFMKILSDAL